MKREPNQLSDCCFFSKSHTSGSIFKEEWARPKVTTLADINFCVIDSVYRTVKTPDAEYDHRRGFEVAIIDLHGIDKEGHSVCCHVHGFEPYFYLQCSQDINTTVAEEIRNQMNIAGAKTEPPTFAEKIEIVNKINIFGFNQVQRFLKVTTRLPKMVATFRKLIEEGNIRIPGCSNPLTFESNVDFVIRFMSDKHITGVSWVTIPQGSYRSVDIKSRTTTSQIEIDCNHSSLIPHPPDGEWMQIPQFRILSFDIEVGGSPDHFPTAESDSVIQICAYVTLQDSPKPLLSAAFVLDTCTPIVGTNLYQFESEADLLQSWQEFIRFIDPDIITGYNISAFDWPYLANRAKVLGVEKFPFLGRYIKEQSHPKKVSHQTKQLGTREYEEVEIPGVITIDMLTQIQNDYKLRSYTLNAVSAQFLNDQKEDVHFSIISKLQAGTATDRHRLAIYCVKDSYLPMQLMSKLLSVVTAVELSRVCRVPLSYLITRGQQVRVFAQILAKTSEHDMIIPAVRGSKSEEQYKGATVIEPSAGYYRTPIPTLDFNSLYPSIMIAHNICYSTRLTNSEQEEIKNEDGTVHKVSYEESPNKQKFVRREEREGILPEILKELLAARKATRAKIPEEPDPLKKKVLNCRQLALKVSANSVYGFTGATVGKLPCIQISESVTAYGRLMIELTKQTVEGKYCKDNGYEDDAKVIYGDTDSVMVNFGNITLEQAIARGHEAAELVTSKFPPPIKIEFEKAYQPYLLISKKHYAGLLHTRADCWDKMDAKGIETVRRDNCRLVQNLLDRALKIMLIDQKPEEAITFVKSAISDLYDDRIDLSFLVISKTLSKTDYKAKQAHVVLKEKMAKRDPGNVPRLGDRIPFVIIKGDSSLGPTERAEDPLYTLINGIQIDTSYYIEHQLKEPIIRLFTPIMGESRVKSLLEGEHTFKKRQASVGRVTIEEGQKNSKKSKGSLLGFVQVLEKCVCGKTGIPKGQKPVCSNCKNRINEVYQEKMNMMRYWEDEHTKLWTMCQRCQGSLMSQNICTAADCPIFYRRKKAQIELEDCYKALKRFDLLV